MLLEFTISALILIGAAFALLGSVGLARLPDLFTRLHGPTKATTLGVGALLIASIIHFSSRGETLTMRELAITLFLFITAPVSAHMIAKAAYKGRPAPGTGRRDQAHSDS
jgi:multicomponent K+:H+ antiporter subunit G